MHRQILSGPWWFRSADGTEWLPARVPGSVHLDLLALGRIPDPFLGDGLRHAAWVAEKDWEYRCAFQSDFALAAAERVELVCGGLDTVAEVFLNGERLGEARNMFRSYRWAVKPLLRPGVNVLLIRLRSPLAFVWAQHRRRPLPGLGHPGVAHLRKAPSHFGWDWGPKLPPMGIWRPVALEGFSIARIADLHIRQHHHGERVTLALQARVERWRDLPLSMRITLMDPEGNVTRWELPVEEEAFTAELPVLRPHRWWPNGLGEQPLYVVETELRGLPSGPEAGGLGAADAGASAGERCVGGILRLRRQRRPPLRQRRERRPARRPKPFRAGGGFGSAGSERGRCGDERAAGLGRRGLRG
jgi:beta-mannosidase